MTHDVKRKSLRLRLASLQEKIATAPYSYLVLCAIVPMAINYLIYLAMEIHPFGSSSVLVLDLNAQYVYYHEALREAICGDGSFLYSFSRSLGGEFLGMYAYYLASPLSLIVVFFPPNRILEAMLTIILLKTGLCGLSFGFYLHKNTAHPNRVITVAFAVLYALCAYATVYQSNLMWMDALIWLPILTYSIEQLIKNRRYKLFVVSLTMVIVSNYYIGYMMCIFTALYFTYYFLANTKEERNPHGERRHTARSLLRFIFFVLISLAISAFVLLAAYYSLSFGKTEFSSPNWDFRPKFQLLDFFTKFLPGSYDSITPVGLPFVYCGVLTLLLLPLWFLSRRIPARKKLASLGLILFFVISFISSPLDLIWHGLQNPNWLNYRYSFMLSFFLLILAYQAFGNLREHSEKFLLGVSAGLILFVTVCDKLEFSTYLETNQKLLTLETIWLTVLCTIALFTILCLLVRQKNPRKRENLAGILAAVVCIEVFCSGLTCAVQMDKEVLYTSYSGYVDFIGNLRPVINQVKEQDDGFYRMEKLRHRKCNDNMALSMRGLSNSTSTLHAEAIQFLKSLGYTARIHKTQYNGGTPVSDSLLGVKYLIDSTGSDTLTNIYSPVVFDENYTAYRNPYALSIAYGVNDSLRDYSINQGDIFFERMNDLVGEMLGEKRSPKLFVPVVEYEEIPAAGCQRNVFGGQRVYTPQKELGESSVTLEYVAPESEEYYFYTPPRAATATTLHVYNHKTLSYERLGEYLGQDTNHIVSLGYFEAGQSIKIKIELDDEPLSVYSYYDYLWYLDRDVFEETFATLQEQPQFVVTEHTEDRLYGTLNTDTDSQMILTTIPYDEGWKIYVDGIEQAPYKALDALIAFDVAEAGEHTLELRYDPEIYHMGAIISIAGISLFLLICATDTIILFVKKKKRATAYPLLGEPWHLFDFDEDDEAMMALPKETKGRMRLADAWTFLRSVGKRRQTPPEDSFVQAEESPDQNDENTPKGEQ